MLKKEMILKLLRESNCIESPILNRFFKSVWVGEEMRQRIEKTKRKTRSA
jgi:hypothetical protein